MNELLFAISFSILLFVFLKRHSIVEYCNFNFATNLTSEIIVYILTVLFIALIMAGMLLDNTKQKFSDISQSYENFKPKDESRPHRYFDVNTYD